MLSDRGSAGAPLLPASGLPLNATDPPEVIGDEENSHAGATIPADAPFQVSLGAFSPCRCLGFPRTSAAAAVRIAALAVPPDDAQLRLL